MKKIFCWVIGSFLVMFFIWTMMIWIQYPDFMLDPSKYHLDLYTMFVRFNAGADETSNFISTFRSFLDDMKKINTDNPYIKAITETFNGGSFSGSNGWTIVLNAINALINPIYAIANSVTVFGYLCVLLTQFIYITTMLATAIFDFIFSPVVIKTA